MAKIRLGVPYFKRLSAEFNLPAEFSSWQEFLTRMPVMTKGTIQAHHQELTSLEKAPDKFRATGGSTAEPITIPSWNSGRGCDQIRYLAREKLVRGFAQLKTLHALGTVISSVSGAPDISTRNVASFSTDCWDTGASQLMIATCGLNAAARID